MGGVAGAGLTMLFVPRVAAELRRRVKDSARDLGRAASKRHQQASTRVGDAVDELTKIRAGPSVTRWRCTSAVCSQLHSPETVHN
jgi:gas vesicle protein